MLANLVVLISVSIISFLLLGWVVKDLSFAASVYTVLLLRALPGVVVLLVGSRSQESDLCSNERSRTSTATHPSVQRPGSASQPATVTSEFDKSLFAAYTLAITLLLILLFLKSSDPRPLWTWARFFRTDTTL